MGERKVVNKYYPPDFDPSKLPKSRRPEIHQTKIRTMLSMSIRCKTCGNYMSRGTKFNSRKENVAGESYLGIQVCRFYIKCTRCSAELIVKTDPQNSDFTVESGATRNFEPWRAADEELDLDRRRRGAEEMGDPMKSLENRTLDSKREIDDLAALDEMKSTKSRRAAVSVDAVLEALQRGAEKEEKKLTEEDENLIKSIDFLRPKDFVKRIDDKDLDDDGDLDDGKDLNQLETGKNENSDGNVKRRKRTDILPRTSTFLDKSRENSASGSPDCAKFIFETPSVRVSVSKKPVIASNYNVLAKLDGSVEANNGLLSLCHDYGSDED